MLHQPRWLKSEWEGVGGGKDQCAKEPPPAQRWRLKAGACACGGPLLWLASGLLHAECVRWAGRRAEATRRLFNDALGEKRLADVAAARPTAPLLSRALHPCAFQYRHHCVERVAVPDGDTMDMWPAPNIEGDSRRCWGGVSSGRLTLQPHPQGVKSAPGQQGEVSLTSGGWPCRNRPRDSCHVFVLALVPHLKRSKSAAEIAFAPISGESLAAARAAQLLQP